MSTAMLTLTCCYSYKQKQNFNLPTKHCKFLSRMCSRFCPDRTLLIIITEPQHDISNNVLCATSKGLDQDLSLKGGCTGSSQSTLCQMPQCWKSHIVAQIIIPKQNSRLGMSVTTQGGSGRQCVTGPGRNIPK